MQPHSTQTSNPSLAEVEHLINEMQEQGVIQPSKSPWASPSMLVQEKMAPFEQSHKERLLPITYG